MIKAKNIFILVGLLVFGPQAIAQNDFKDSLDIMELDFQEFNGSSLKQGHYTLITDAEELPNSSYTPIANDSLARVSFYPNFIEDDTVETVGLLVISQKEKQWIKFNIDFEIEANEIKVYPGGKDFPDVFLIEYEGYSSFNRGEESRRILEIWTIENPKRLARINLKTNGSGSFLDPHSGTTTVESIDYSGEIKYNNGNLTIKEEQNSASKIEIDSNEVETNIYESQGIPYTIVYKLLNGYFIKQ